MLILYELDTVTNTFDANDFTMKSFGATMKHEKKEPIEVKCPKCNRTEIIYLQKEDFPKCPDCKIEMVIKELLDEGKSY